MVPKVLLKLVPNSFKSAKKFFVGKQADYSGESSAKMQESKKAVCIGGGGGE